MMLMKHLDMQFDVKAVQDDGTFAGYGSVFGVIDSYNDIVTPGAFTESIKTRQPSMLWQHQRSEPIGIYTGVKEDTVGLHLEGRLALKTTRGAEAYELLKMGAISGLSIGFMVREESYDRVTKINTLKKLDLWEVSLVTFPANDASRVTDVKSIDAIKTLKEAEAILRELGGFSKSQALAMVARIKAAARSDSDEVVDMAAAITRNIELYKSRI